MNYYIIEGSRKKSKLYVYNSQLYLYHRQTNSHLTVRCREWKSAMCKARGRINKENDTFEVNGEHLHATKEDEIEKLKMMAHLKRASESAPESLRTIFDTVSSSTPIDIASQISFNQVEMSPLYQTQLLTVQ